MVVNSTLAVRFGRIRVWRVGSCLGVSEGVGPFLVSELRHRSGGCALRATMSQRAGSKGESLVEAATGQAARTPHGMSQPAPREGTSSRDTDPRSIDLTATIVPDLTAMPATMTIPEAARLLGISRSAAYRAVARGEIPTIRIGRRLLVPTAKLYTMLGWLPDPAA